MYQHGKKVIFELAYVFFIKMIAIFKPMYITGYWNLLQNDYFMGSHWYKWEVISLNVSLVWTSAISETGFSSAYLNNHNLENKSLTSLSKNYLVRIEWNVLE